MKKRSAPSLKKGHFFRSAASNLSPAKEGHLALVDQVSIGYDGATRPLPEDLATLLSGLREEAP